MSYDEKACKQAKKMAIEHTRQWLEMAYGKRCKVFGFGCPSCEMWRYFDSLFFDQGSEYSWNQRVRRYGGKGKKHYA